MQTLSTADDFVTLAAQILQSRDTTRLEYLKQAATLADAEYNATLNEQKRLIGKYGADSPQAGIAAERLSSLKQESAALTDSIVRASIPLPVIDDQTFVVYGRVLDSQGKEVTGARIAANAADGTTAASTTSRLQGRFEVRVPTVSKRKKSTKAATDELAASTANTVQLAITTKSLPQPYIYPETLTVTAGRVCYREILLPDASQTG